MEFVEISDLGQVTDETMKLRPRVPAVVRPIARPVARAAVELPVPAKEKMPKVIRWFVLGFSVLLGLTVLSQVLKKQTS